MTLCAHTAIRSPSCLLRAVLHRSLHAHVLTMLQPFQLIRCHTSEFIPAPACVGLQRNAQDLITQDSNLDSDVGLNLIQLLGGSSDVYGTKRRRNGASSASDDSFIRTR